MAYHEKRVKNMEKPLKIGKDHKLAKWLVDTISAGYSPAAACALLGKTPETTFSCTLCRQTVYKYIENGEDVYKRQEPYKTAAGRKTDGPRCGRAGILHVPERGSTIAVGRCSG